MSIQEDDPILVELMAKVERAWIDDNDRHLVEMLVAKYPEYTEELYEHFDDLVDETLEEAGSANEGDERIADWVRTEGIDLALGAKRQHASESTDALSLSENRDASSETILQQDPHGSATDRGGAAESRGFWLATVSDRSGRSIREVCQLVEHGSREFLTQVGRYPQLVPAAVKQAIALNLEQAIDLPYNDVLELLDAPHEIARAASRSAEFAEEPADFSSLVARSGLSPKDRAHWLALAKSVKP